MTESCFNKFIESEEDVKNRQAPGNAKSGKKKKRANVIYFKGSHGIVLVSPVYKTNTIILSPAPLLPRS